MDRTDLYKEQLYSRFTADLQQQERVKRLVAYLGRYRFGRFLDIGCGDGGLTAAIAAAVQAGEVKALEISAQGGQAARDRGIDCAVVDIDRDSLPFENGYFDFVFCGEIIEHVFDPDRLLEYAHRVLKPGGMLMITTPNIAAWHCRAYILLGYNPIICSASIRHHEAGKLLKISSGKGIEHIRYFTLRALRDLVRSWHFTVVREFGFHVDTGAAAAGPVRSLVNAVDRWFTRAPSLASTIGILCRK